MLGTQELLLIFLAIILLFGTSKLPELARSIGKASGEFKKAQIDTANEIRRLETPINETKNIPHNVIKLAADLGISTEGKDESLILDEIKAIMKSKV